MKKYLLQLVCLLSLFFIFSCGDTEDTDSQQISVLPQRVISKEQTALAKTRNENPDAWADQNLARLIEKHGDSPDVRTVADFMEKIEYGRPIDTAEYETYIDIMRKISPKVLTMDEYYVKLEAESQLSILQSDIEQCRVEVFRVLKTEGLSFHQIDWTELDQENRFCQTGYRRQMRRWH